LKENASEVLPLSVNLTIDFWFNLSIFHSLPN
jgi:hypothetical protein